MTASGVQQKTGRGRRIIERPRLIKLLDETDARTILLLAPAGYGKTTLARQWLTGFKQVIAIALTPSHRDIAWLAEEFARAIESRDPGAGRLIREHVRAHPNPGPATSELGRVIGGVLHDLRADCIFLDNYEELGPVPEVESAVNEIEAASGTRLLIASRLRPRWISQRRTLYGEVCVVEHAQLAMTREEIVGVIGRHRTAERLAEQAKGWPAVISLAASLDSEALPTTSMPQALHRYLAEEVFSRTEPCLREKLFTLALLGDEAGRTMEARAPAEFSWFVAAADAAGFGLSESYQLHPLLRDFLLEKLLDEPDWRERLREAVGVSLSEGQWENALDLIGRFQLEDLDDPALRVAFKPLTRSGRLQSLKNLANRSRDRSHQRQSPSIDVVLAEIEFCDGNFELASEIATRALARLDDRHPLASRAAAIVGQTALFDSDFAASETAFLVARRTAQDERDESEALYGLAQTTILGEFPRASEIVEELMARRHRSPVDLVRACTSRISYLHIGGGGMRETLHLDAIKEALPHVADPRVRPAATYMVAYALSATASYGEASDWIELFLQDARQFKLDFSMPYGLWVVARIALGQRRYADAERALQAIEDIATRGGDLNHLVNAQSLRARLLLQNAALDEARLCTEHAIPEKLLPSWRAEFLATRALVLSVAGETHEAVSAARDAAGATRAHEVVVLAHVAIAIASKRAEHSRAAIELAASWNVWDPVICGARASSAFADMIASDPKTRSFVEALYSRTQDVSLARRAGFRTRSTRAPGDLLSPRELEVLGLVARGCTNREISRALFISDSTTKVHVRHIFEKLGVRTRAEAVARYEMFRNTSSGDS